MIRTITESEALTLAVRGDVPGVLDGLPPAFVLAWLGPAPGSFENKIRRIKDLRGATGMGLKEAKEAIEAEQGAATAGLPLANPLVQAHLVGWLGRGEKCPLCLGRGKYEDALPSEPLLTCWNCRGVGRIRPCHNRYAWLTPTDHGGLPDWVRMALIWGSVVRVAAGMGALTEALGPWAPDVGSLARDTWGRPLIGSCLVLRSAGYATSDADRRWLADGKALLDDAPAGRVIRFGVPDAP